MVAFLHYWIGMSLDHVCDVLRFFTQLELPKSQADSLLTQLSTDWSQQYDTIAELLALQLVIYVDETGWKVGRQLLHLGIFNGTACPFSLRRESFEVRSPSCPWGNV